MLILAIDTSSRMGSVALLRDNHVLGEISGHEETLYSMRLFRDLEVLQSRAQFRLDEIDVFAVAAGPGSFTGLRVGLTAVKAWAEVHSKPIAAVSGLEAVAVQSEALRRQGDRETGVVAPFMDARRGQIFGSLYRCQSANPVTPALDSLTALDLSPIVLRSLGEESVFTAEEFLEMVKGTIHMGTPVLVSPTPDLMPANQMAQILPGVSVEAVSPVLAPVIGRLGFAQARRGNLVDSLQLDANYVRRSDAESAWKDR